MKLFKAHGLGNDYLVLVEGDALTEASVVALCDRHHGVGADGVLEPMASSLADHGVRIWNPDGSIAEKSGNGLRIFAYWLSRDCGAGAAFTVDTGHDVVECEVAGTHVEIEMGPAVVGDLDGAAIQVGDHVLDVTSLRIGNPHAVIWMAEDTDLDRLPWRAWGAALETDRARFPDRTNVQCAVSVGPGVCAARIWERGAGETLASGSSACAVAAVAVHRGLHARNQPIEVRMPGGSLHVSVHDDGVRLAGPVAPIASLVIDPAWVS